MVKESKYLEINSLKTGPELNTSVLSTETEWMNVLCNIFVLGLMTIEDVELLKCQWLSFELHV